MSQHDTISGLRAVRTHDGVKIAVRQLDGSYSEAREVSPAEAIAFAELVKIHATNAKLEKSTRLALPATVSAWS